MKNSELLTIFYYFFLSNLEFDIEKFCSSSKAEQNNSKETINKEDKTVSPDCKSRYLCKL